MSYETWGESYLSLRTELLSEIRKAARHPGTAPSLSFLLLSERLFHSSLYTPVLTVSQSIKKKWLPQTSKFLMCPHILPFT